MRVIDVRKKRGRQCAVYLDGEEPVILDRRTWEESGYRIGSELSERVISELTTLSQRNRAREKALYLLSLRDHSREELARKLREGDNAAIAEQTAERMEELGLIDDAAYAGRLARELRLRKLYAYRRTVQELCSRGISRELAEAAADAVETDDTKQALALLEKKRYNKLDYAEDQRKAAAMLARYGYTYEDIRRAFTLLQERAVLNDDPSAYTSL